tara:strand:- start:1125 stop:2477 length:1353 start_codon:yes stop_codon:yes gene_type:complete
MDILDQILNAQKSSREDKVETFKSLFAEEDNVAVQTALAKARQVEEMERLKAKHEQEIEALKDEHERENERLAGAKEKESIDTAIQKKRDAERKANESVEEAFNYSSKDFEAQVKSYKYKNGVKFSQVMKDFEDDWDSSYGNRGFDYDNVVDGLKKALKKARIRFKEDVDEGKLVAGISDIIDAVMKKIKSQVGKEIQKNQEKGLGMLNTLGSFVGAKVSDKKQEKGKLFLKWGDNISEDYGRGDQKGVAKIRGKSYFDSSVGDGWESALKDMLLGHITQREFERAFPALTKKDFETLLKSKEMKVRTQRWGVNDRDYKKKISQLMKGLKEGRNYKKEYENYHSKPEQIKRRAKRNEARRMLKNRKGIKGKDVHHKDNNPLNNDKSNLSIVSQKYNRTEPRLREKLGKDATIGDFIKDFKKSNAPQFKNQSAEEIKKMAVAAYYANQKRG